LAEGISLDDKVVVITGGGGAIGRAIALQASQAGAKVVLNDLGSGLDGQGRSISAAQDVADEIVAAGGSAIANGDSVADQAGAEAIIGSAIDRFGRIDCVINVAGILRDRMFYNMSSEEWDAVIKVHLYGCYHVSRAAAPHFKKQSSGSFVHFTSPAGLIGSVGQANYAAAKMGIVGLSTSIALDMRKYNVRSNCVAPSAWSRMLEAIPARTDEEREKMARLRRTMGPEKIGPLCVFLASDSAADVSGQIFKIKGNEIFLMSQPRPVRSMHRDGGWTPETIATAVIPAFRTAFTPLELHTDVFSWDPL
jgi:NAD(P)-dependent dehydrogenase (short-subunit alcohol dehydrogenase family)